jgi:predicted transcriptional regulator
MEYSITDSEFMINMSPLLDSRLSRFESILTRIESKLNKLENDISNHFSKSEAKSEEYYQEINKKLDTKLEQIEKGSDETHDILYKNRELYTSLLNTIKETESHDIKIVLEELHKNNEILLQNNLDKIDKRRFENLYWRYSGVGIIKNILQNSKPSEYIKKP